MKKLMFLLVFCTLSISGAWAQKTFKGKVIGPDGLGLPGVNVVEKANPVNGAATDIDGNWTLTVPSENTILELTAIGMKPIEIAAKNALNLKMESDAQVLDEVMVVAYGTAKKSTFTGAASEVKTDQLESIPTPTFTEALQGNASGIQVNSSSGDPGSGAAIRIRGIGSLNAEATPLYVVDGIVVNSGNVSQLYNKEQPDNLSATDVLSTLNPSDIKSITILKDASATSIYGARAANGVILITTKKGKAGKAKISFDAKWGISNLASKGYEFMSSEQYYKTYFDAYIREGKTAKEANAKTIGALTGNNPYSIANPLDDKGNLVSGAKLYANTDWVDEVFRSGKTEEYNLSAAGGTEKVNYFISLGYSNQEGIIGGSDFERINMRSNISANLTKKLKVGTNTSLTYTEQNRASASTAGASSTYNALTFPNAVPVYELDKNGSPKTDKKGNLIYNFKNPVSIDFNPLYTVQNDIYNTKTYRILSGIYAELDMSEILEGLKFRSDESIDFYTVDDFQFYNPFHGNGPSVNGRGYSYGTWNTYWTTSNKLSYDKKFNEHHISTLIGYETSENRERVNFAHGTQYAIYGDVVLPELKNSAEPKDAQSWVNKWSMMSYLARVNYDYKDRYYVSLSWRNDGSSRFGKEKRRGNFYSVGASWRMTEEKFLKNLSWLDNLKLRASYGTSGNDQVGLYDYFTNFSPWNYDGKPGNALYRPGNPQLGWEQSASFTVGVDYTMLNRRLSGSLEYYTRTTSDLLYKTPISRVSGFENVTKNSAKMTNSGFEFQVDFRAIDSRKFKWNIGLNLTKNTNKIKDLSVEKEILGSKIWKEGGSMYDFYLYEWAGVDKENGNPLWYAKEKDSEGKETGRKITTSNRNKADRFVVGSAQPDFYGGFQNTLSYGGWTLSANVYFSVGGNILDIVESDILSDGAKQGFQLSKKQLNSWRPDNKNTNVPKFTPNSSNESNYNFSTRYMYDATYAKIKAITLSHNFSKTITSKLRISNLSIYFSGGNLFTWTKDSNFDGFDPEVGLNGLTSYVTPNPRTFTLGVKIGL